jgi:hypothetical protein
MVVLRRSRCACPLFSRNCVVFCRSGLVVLRKYEAYNEACLDLAVRNILSVSFKNGLIRFASGLRSQHIETAQNAITPSRPISGWP